MRNPCTRVATWSVRGLLHTEKLMNVRKELIRYNLTVTGRDAPAHSGANVEKT